MACNEKGLFPAVDGNRIMLMMKQCKNCDVISGYSILSSRFLAENVKGHCLPFFRKE